MKFLKNHSREFLFAAAGFLCVILIVFSFLMLSDYSNELKEQAELKSRLYSQDNLYKLEDNVEELKMRTELLASKLSERGYETEFALTLDIRSEMEKKDILGDVQTVRFFRDGVEYGLNNSPYSSQESSKVLEAVKEDRTCFAGYIENDVQYSRALIAFTAPVKNCAYADHIAVFFPVKEVLAFIDDVREEYISCSRLTALCSDTGEVISVLFRDENVTVANHQNIFEIIHNTIYDTTLVGNVEKIIGEVGFEVFSTTVEGESHSLAVGSVGEPGRALSVFSLYRASDIYDVGYATVDTILGALIVFSGVLIALAAYLVISRRKTAKKILTMHDVDITLNCPTRTKFERDAKEIIARNRGTAFAIVVVDMKHFNYLADQFDSNTVSQVLAYLKVIYRNMLRIDETYGYAVDGRFLLLLHYREKEDLVERLQLARTIVSGYSGKLPSSYHIDLFGGIYEVKRGLTDKIGKMIDFAMEAKDTFAISQSDAFKFYSDELQQRHEQSEYIEVHMNSALEQRNFIVFYQPKYNIANDRPDGSEALVRWYNPETDEYMRPGIFMPLFESNGFVVKLDKYVYENVCEYIEESVARGDRLYPVSVNVSRITAAQKDFLDYYIDVKRKHHIADGFLTIEFTESFAYENYEMLRELVAKLHANGFKCSIDDFGSGYSSYNILKELQMDELKLDTFFIQRGLSADRDNKILASVISLARELNLKVTQEGVETIDQLELLKKLGCQVIQGYHYSKPLALSDYIDFITKR